MSLTTWSKRIGNIPAVLDTILAQSIKPDLIVLNLAFNEQIPKSIQAYIDKNGIEIYRVADTKVYKKLIPTLKRYPNDIIINIDDDWLYPSDMIADFIDIHNKYPNNPISGNGLVYSEMICHCGCASLTKADFFEQYIDSIDDDVIKNCPCSDIVYTYFANKAGHPYITTKNEYFTNMTPFNEEIGYSTTDVKENSLKDSLSFLIQKYGIIPQYTNGYVNDPYIADILYHIHSDEKKETRNNSIAEIRSTHAYKTGRLLLKPLSMIRHILSKD